MTDDTAPQAFELPPELASEGPADLADHDTPPARCTEDGCTDAVVRTGKGGRPPKKCPKHKDSRGGRNPAPNNRSGTSGKSWPRATEVETILSRYVGGLGYGIRLVNPEDGRIIADNGPAVIHELVELAKTDTQLRKPLELLATPGKYGPLTLAIGAVVVPILANHGLLPQIQLSGLASPAGPESPNLRAV